MKEIIKTSLFGLSVWMLAVPVMVRAQFDKGLEKAQEESGLPQSDIGSIVQSLMMWLLYILAFIAVIAFVISGFLYLTSAGNEERAETAKNAMVYAIIGVIVSLLGVVILRAAFIWLGGGSMF